MFFLIINSYKTYEIDLFSKFIKDLKIIDISLLKIKEDKLYYEDKIVKLPKRALFWLGCMTTENDLLIYSYLVENKVSIINNLEESLLFKDKHHFNLKYTDKKSKTYNLEELIDNNERILKDFSFPFILKGSYGSLGKGIFKVNTINEFKHLIEMIELLDKDFEFFIEEYIDYKEDIRMFIIGDHYYLMNRINKNSFKANYSQGAHLQIKEDNDKFKQLFKFIRANFDSKVIGVDILIDKNDNYIICELNSSPGLEGITSLYGEEVILEIIKEIYV